MGVKMKMDKRKHINFEEAIELNKTEPVGFYFAKGENIDETWFPINFLWNKNLSKLPLLGYTLADLKHGVWLRD
jgi:hypothetical protein